MRKASIVAAIAVLGAATPSASPPRWGAHGHEMAARAALAVLPPEMPEFFREAADQLVYLDPEPDRWRSADRPEMRAAWAQDHFINLERVPQAALDAPDRWAYMAALRAAGVERPDEVGFLPFTIVERYQRLVTEWELWRSESDETRRHWIEERIVNDAGILGHFVTDGSQPLHTSVHYNGWAAGSANPSGFTTDRTLHIRFEADFVDAFVRQSDVTSRVGAPLSVAHRARAAVFSYLRSTQERVEDLYRLDRDVGFDPGGPARPEAVQFAADRLADGARMLAVVWSSAWEESR